MINSQSTPQKQNEPIAQQQSAVDPPAQINAAPDLTSQAVQSVVPFRFRAE